MSLAPVRLVAPSAMPVLLEEVKEHLRMTSNAQDDHLTRLIGVSFRNLDGRAGILGRCIMEQTWRSFATEIGNVRLPFGDAKSAIVHYFDRSNVEASVPTSAYSVLNDHAGGFVRFDPAFLAPPVFDRPDAVWLDVVYGMSDEDIQPVAQAICLMVEQMLDGVDRKPAIDSLLSPLRMLAV